MQELSQQMPEDESARPSVAEASQETPTVSAAAAISAKGAVRGIGEKPSLERASMEESARINKLIQHHAQFCELFY